MNRARQSSICLPRANKCAADAFVGPCIVQANEALCYYSNDKTGTQFPLLRLQSAMYCSSHCVQDQG